MASKKNKPDQRAGGTKPSASKMTGRPAAARRSNVAGLRPNPRASATGAFKRAGGKVSNKAAKAASNAVGKRGPAFVRGGMGKGTASAKSKAGNRVARTASEIRRGNQAFVRRDGKMRTAGMTRRISNAQGKEVRAFKSNLAGLKTKIDAAKAKGNAGRVASLTKARAGVVAQYKAWRRAGSAGSASSGG